VSGIVGIVNIDGQPVDRVLLERLTEFLDFRGPDARETWIDGNVGFGHTMLRTTDEAENERQPFSLDGRAWITADCRIDGRADLIRKLAGTGREIGRDAPDPELILHAYSAWGEKCVEHLLGDFSFAIWDRKDRRLFCARDHFGVKPFFYARLGHSFVFSNTLNCLRLHPGISDTLNEIVIGDFLLSQLNHDPVSTTFADIRRLPAAHVLTLGSNGTTVERYWSLPLNGHLRYSNPHDYVEHFAHLLEAAVDDRLRTSRVSLEMSGGLDSPSIACIAKKMLGRSGKTPDVQAYTWVFDSLIPDRERYFAGLVARHVDLPIHFFAADDYPLFEPRGRGSLPSPEPFYLYRQPRAVADFYSLIAGRSRVLLTGWDGDALLSEKPGPYLSLLLRNQQFSELANALAWFLFVKRRIPPVGIRTWIKRKFGRYPIIPPYPKWLNPEFAERVDLPCRHAQINAESPPLHPMKPAASRLLFVPNWWQKFESYDPGVTGLALEARHPLIDIRLVEYILAIPTIPWSIEKHILRVAMTGFLPRAILRRPKSPLAGYVAFEKLRSPNVDWLKEFKTNAVVGNYVARGAMPDVIGEEDTDLLWMNLRPFMLNAWFEATQPFAQLK